VAAHEFPASFGQRRMWLLAEMNPGAPAYNITRALWLDGPLEVGALQQAFDAARARHQTLRTTFRNESGVPVQVIEDEPGAQPLLVTSVEQYAPPERATAALDVIRRHARIPFDLATGPLLRAAAVRLAADSHVLALVMHDIIADGWSFRLLFDELSADYEAIRLGGPPVADEPPAQYADFARWQLQHDADGGYASDARFWQAELTDARTALLLPTDRPYPARPTFAAQYVNGPLDRGLASAMREVAVRNGSTLAAVLLAAYAVVLSRLTGCDDLLIAVPMAARTRPETESVVGPFLNTVPVRVRIDRDATLSRLVRAVHAATARAQGHQDLPFARVVELVGPGRDQARLPLGQVMFATEESWSVPDRGGLRWRPERVENGTARFEIELTVTDAAEGPQVRVGYNSDLFDPATGQLVADGFVAILRSLRDDPDLPVANAHIMSPDVLALVTADWPDAGPVADPDATALALLRAACTGDSVVATGRDGELTGAGIRDLAGAITAALRAHGTGIGDRVAILLSRGARLLPAILGVWSAGASFVPLDPADPGRRLAAMLADSGAAAIVVDGSAPEATGLPAAAAPIPVLDLAALASPAPDHADSRDPMPDLPPSATAITIFTSGPAARPTAVSLTHGGVAALLGAVRPLIALGPKDRFVAVSSFAFDIALVELLVPVLAGGRVVVAAGEQVRDAARLRELLTETGATAMQATPAAWRRLVDAGGIPAGVKVRMTGGEPLPRDLADTLSAGAGVRVWNLYGPTETTIYSGGDAVEPAPAPIEIGSTIAGTRLYVLDAGLRPVPPGVPGEIYIGGAGIARGYHGAPGLTAGRFVADPFSGVPGARMYRTGDLGRWRESGRIELAGRADRQIRIGGYRVESGEVEAALRSHEDVAEAVVSLRGAGQDVRIVGYLVTRAGAELSPDELRTYLREVLPDYMVPAAFVTLPALPLTGTGKTDYHALPEPDWGPADGPGPVAPRTPEEARIAAFVAELLELPAPAGVTDNFFLLGGQSLTAIELMERIRSAYSVDLPLKTLFSDPTVAGLAAAVAAAAGADAAGPAGPPRPADLGEQGGDRPLTVEPGGTHTRLPVSFGQQRLWFLDQLTPGEPTFNRPYSIWLDGPLDAGALQRAMDSVAARQAALRTSIVAFDGVPEQVVAESGTVPIERVDLSAEPDQAERIRQAESIAADRAGRPFDLARGPLMRAALVAAGPDRHLLILVMHHSISDSATMRIVMAELSAFYRAEKGGGAASLPSLWMEFGDYAVWQRDRLRGEELERLLSYWRGQLRGAPELLSLPADRPRPARQSSRGAVAAATLDAGTTARLAAVAHGIDTTLAMVFLTGFAATLSRYARQRDIVIGTQVAGRTHAELDQIAGMFANTVALRLSLADDPTFAGLLGRVKNATQDALAYAELPFEKLVEDLAPGGAGEDRSLAPAPIVQVQFVYGSLSVPPLDVPGISSHGQVLFTGTSRLDLTMYADTRDDQSTTLTMEYSTDRFDPPWADQFLRGMVTLLTHAAEAPGTAVADLPLRSNAEAGKLVAGR
jgi:amino acid adenylation domain-containing protein